MIINKDYMMIMRAGKNWTTYEPKKQQHAGVVLAVCLLLAAIMFVFFAIPAHAYTLDQYADAIHKAEGNDNYGVLAHYKHTTPRQACKNTVWHRWLVYKESGLKTPFVAFLGASYCPVGASNDPTGLNQNWVRNVTYFLEVKP